MDPISVFQVQKRFEFLSGFGYHIIIVQMVLVLPYINVIAQAGNYVVFGWEEIFSNDTNLKGVKIGGMARGGI